MIGKSSLPKLLEPIGHTKISLFELTRETKALLNPMIHKVALSPKHERQRMIADYILTLSFAAATLSELNLTEGEQMKVSDFILDVWERRSTEMRAWYQEETDR